MRSKMAHAVAQVAARQQVPVIFKASFDKANRTSRRHSFRGPGLDQGLEILAEVRSATGLPVLTDVHETSQVSAVAAVVDVLQIPAFLSRQSDLLAAAAATGKPVNIKKGQFLAPLDMRTRTSTRSTAGGHHAVLITERGVSFGYNNLIVTSERFR